MLERDFYGSSSLAGCAANHVRLVPHVLSYCGYFSLHNAHRTYNYHVIHVELVRHYGMTKALVCRRAMIIWIIVQNVPLIKEAVD
jgi:hypothetical protein